MKVSTIFNNFSRGRVDHDLNSRYDLPAFSSGCDVFENFFSNFKGNAIYRYGWERMLKHEDCALVRFRFNQYQDYLLFLYNTKMKIGTYDTSGNFGFVQSGGSDLVVTTPWSLAQSKELATRGCAQNGDVMIMCHSSVAPYVLTRVSATSFTLATFSRTGDPFTGAGLYPSCCEFYEGAIYYAAPTTKKTTIWRSKIGDYYTMTIGTGADDGFKREVAGLTEEILWLKAGANALIAGSSQGLIPVTGGAINTPITPTNAITKVADTDGANTAVPVKKDNLLFYVKSDGRNVNYFSYDIIQEAFQSKDSNIGSYQITSGGITKLAYKKDANNLIWGLRNSVDLVSLNFNLDERIIGWHEHTSQADIKDISALNDHLGAVRLFGLVKYGATYYICRMAEQVTYPRKQSFFIEGNDESDDTLVYNRYIAELLKQENHLDISSFVQNYYTSTITYTGDTAVGSIGTIVSTAANFGATNVGHRIVYRTQTGMEYGMFKITGYTNTTTVTVEVLQKPSASVYAAWYRTFSVITGLTDYIGETMGVVGDGGYLGEFVVDASGEVDLGREITVACIGFTYDALIKTFDLGFMLNGVNTQQTKKSLNRSYIRFISSAGGKVGSSLYRMEDIQDFNPDGYFDIPPLPMDGSSSPVVYSDEYNVEKSIYIMQDKPLPFQITGVISEVDYVPNL